MKNILVITFLFSLFACKSKPEPNLQLFNPEAFAFDVGGSWEVNSTINAKGFAQKENNDEFVIKLFYTVDLITLENDTLKSIFTDSLLQNEKTEFVDIPIEAQIELDSSFSIGEYKIIFNVEDKFSKQKKSAEVKFTLTVD